MKKFLFLFVSVLACSCFGRGALPIYGGRLDSDLNANQHSITNLPDSFFSRMIETNGVPPSRTITINNVVGSLGTNLAFTVEGGGGGIGEEEDPIALPIATNALAIAQAAAPQTRTINAKALTSNISLSASDVGAVPLIGGLAAAEMFKATYGGLGGYSTLTPGTLTIGWSSASTVLPLKIDEDGISGKTFSISWPERFGGSQIATIADIDDALEGVTVDEGDPLSVHTSGGTMTGLLTLSSDGLSLYGSGTPTNFIVRAEYDGTNVSFNIYEVER